MNRNYRLIWSHHLNSLVAVAESVRGRGKSGGKAKTIASAVAGALIMLGAGQAMAADLCGAGTTSITTAQATNNNCALDAGQSVNISSAASISISSTGGVAGISVATGVTAGSIINAGTITGNDTLVMFFEHAPVEIFGSLTNGFTNTGLITRTIDQNTPAVDVGAGTISSFYNAGRIMVDGDPSHGATAITMNGTRITGSLSNSGTITTFDSRGITLTHVTVGGGIFNSGIIAAGSTALRIENSTVTGGVNNSGIIESGLTSGPRVMTTGTTAIGIYVKSSTVSGGITNAGTIRIESTEYDVGAIMLSSATVSGGITNSGLIDVLGSSEYIHGIFLDSSTLSGSIINSGTINTTMFSSSSAMGITLYSSTIGGSIINSGTIHATGGTDAAYGIYMTNSSVGGGITNSGTILGTPDTGTGYGIYLSGSSVAGSIVNSGLIAGSATATGTDSASARGLSVENGSEVDSIFNDRGTISATARAVNGSAYATALSLAHSTVSGGVTNTGLILGDGTKSGTSTGVYGVGVYVANVSSIGGAINNLGTIKGLAHGDTYGWALGVIVQSSVVAGGITNSGLISGTGSSTTTAKGEGYGIQLQGSATVENIVNLATGTIVGTANGGGAAGILAFISSTITGGITNAGTIAGDDFAIAISASSVLPHLHLTGTPVLIGDVSAINTDVVLKSGATFANTNAFDVKSFTVESGALLNLGNGPSSTLGKSWSGGSLNSFPALTTNGVKVTNSFTNAGIVSVAATAAPTITGDYAQTGIYRMGLTGTTAGAYGVLNVTGTANVAGGVDVVISGSPAVTNGTTVAGVIHSTGAMTVTPADITVTDNNLFLTFTAATVSGAGNLDLIIAADPNALPNAVGPSSPGTGVAEALQEIYNGGVPAGFQPVFDALATMSPSDLNDALLQLVPSLQGAGAQAGVNALHGMNKIIQSRVESVQGLNSGDETSDQYAWARAFGNWGDQDDYKGVPGFETRTYGIALGMDRPINDRIRAGALATYARSDVKSNLRNANVDVDTYEIAGYGSYNIDPQTDINVQLDLGLNKAESTRRINFLGTRAKADFDSFNYHMSGGIGHLFQVSDKTNVTPSVRVDYTHVRTDGYTERGAGALNLKVKSSTFEELLLTADAKLSHKLNDNGLKFVGNLSAGYDFINERAQTSSTFTGGGPTFVTKGLDPSPWIYRGGLGLVKETGTGLEFSARYDAEWRSSDYLTQTASVKVRWNF